MKILLMQNVAKLGRKGDLKNVKNGYYRNFLFPRGLATIPTSPLLKWAEGVRTQIMKEREEIVKQATAIKNQLEEKAYTILIKTTDKDTLYGSIGEKEIVDLLAKEAKIKLEKKQIELKENIKKVGKYKVAIELSEEVKAVVTIDVAAKEKDNEKKETKAKKTKKSK